MDLCFLSTHIFMLAQVVSDSEPYEGGPLTFFALIASLPLLQFVLGILEIICIIHLIRRGRDWWWLWILLCFPGIGALIYFFVEMYPDLRGRPRRGPGAGRVAGSARKRIRILEKELDLIDTVDKRSQLAAAYLDAGDFQRARELYSECLQGMYADDPHMLYGMARAQFGCRHFQEALEAIEKTFRDDMPDYLPERLLLKARTLEELGKREDALAAYAGCVGRLDGVAGRCRYALLLERCNRYEEAEKEFRAVVSQARIIGKAYRVRDREWIKIARGKVG